MLEECGMKEFALFRPGKRTPHSERGINFEKKAVKDLLADRQKEILTHWPVLVLCSDNFLHSS